MSPLVSVIVPNYNHAKFLGERLSSIFNQTYQNFEVILLDDCSTDNSVEILKKYSSEKKVSHFIVNAENSGSPFKQWQKGVELSKGKYIWIAESDDFCNVDFLEKLMAHFDEKVGLVYCRSLNIDEDSQVVNLDFWPDGLDSSKWKSDFKTDGIEEIGKSLIYRNTIPNASSCIFKKDIGNDFTSIPDFKYAGDWIFWINTIKECDVYYTCQPLNRFRRHPATSRTVKDETGEIRRLEEYMLAIKLGITTLKHYSNSIIRLNVDNYNWILRDIKTRRKSLGLKYYFSSLKFKAFIYFKKIVKI